MLRRPRAVSSLRLALPVAAGIGLRAPHVGTCLPSGRRSPGSRSTARTTSPTAVRRSPRSTRIRADYPLSLHGVGLSLGSADPLDRAHLAS